MTVLYLSYDGMLEPLGESQVVSYVLGLARTHRITLMSYEKARDARDGARRRRMEERLRSRGIAWIPLRYHKWPSLLATGWDALRGLLRGAVVCRKHRVRVIHARGYVASAIGLCLKRLCGARLVFDMRGFWADEKVDAGHWRPDALLYRVAKRWERRLFEEADAIVSLTRAGVKAFASLGYDIPAATAIEVIPTCTDVTRFAPGPKDQALLNQLRLSHRRVIVGCVGTLSNWYLREPTLRYLALLARRLEAAILCVTQEDHARLRADALAAGVPEAQLRITRAAFDAMPAFVRLMDLGVFFVKPSFSKRASAATKLGELLATGVPVVINDGIGDSGEVVRAHRAGIVLPDVTPPLCEASVEEVRAIVFDPTCRERCRRVAQRYFNLEDGIRKYRELYRRLQPAETTGWSAAIPRQIPREAPTEEADAPS